MKSNKEIKENLSTEDSIKEIFENFEKICKVETIKNGKRMFAGISCSSINWKELKSEILQKIKELEKWQVSPSVNDLTDKLIEKENDIERLKHKLLTYSRPIGTSYVDVREEGRKEVNQRWTEKIKELIKHFDFLGSGGDNYAKHVVKRLKPLLGEKE